MSSPSHNERDASPFEAVLRWFRGRAGIVAALGDCDDMEIEQIAHDIGVSSGELGDLAKSDTHAAGLLPQRMAALDLDAKEVEQVAPAIMRDMQRLCTLCQKHRQCARDLARDASDPVWKEYCPNLEPLTSLDAMPWAERNEW